jgi:hypothetical protein
VPTPVGWASLWPGLPYFRDYIPVLSQSSSYFPADTGFLYPVAQIIRICGLVSTTRCLVRR